MNKSELIEKLAIKAQLPIIRAETVVECFLASVSRTLEEGGRVEIRGFGAFSVKSYESYVGRNPRTGESIFVDSKRLPVWRTGTELRNRVDKSGGNCSS